MLLKYLKCEYDKKMYLIIYLYCVLKKQKILRCITNSVSNFSSEFAAIPRDRNYFQFNV